MIKHTFVQFYYFVSWDLFYIFIKLLITFFLFHYNIGEWEEDEYDCETVVEIPHGGTVFGFENNYDNNNTHTQQQTHTQHTQSHGQQGGAQGVTGQRGTGHKLRTCSRYILCVHLSAFVHGAVIHTCMSL